MEYLGANKLKVIAVATATVVMTLLLGVNAASGQVATDSQSVTANVDFNTVTQQVDPTSIGVGSSTYGANPLSSTAQSEAEQKLDARYVRLPVGYRDGRVTSSAAGSASDLDIPALVNLYQSWGYRVLVVIGGRTSDVDVQPGDATKIIQALGTDDSIDYSSPNEPNNKGQTVEQALQTARMIVAEGKALDPDFKLWGPVWTHYSRDSIKAFAAGMGSDLAGIDYHHYAMGGESISTAQAMSETPSFAQEISEIKSDLASLGLDVPVNVDELNFSWRYQDGTPGGNNRFFTSVNTVWMASSLGHILSAGGRGLPYATQNGPLGIMVEAGNVNPDNRPASSPMPGYWGIAAWTGSKVWPHYDNKMYQSSDNDANVETYAVNNEDGGYNLVVINKDEYASKGIALNLQGVNNGSYKVYQSNPATPYDQPTVTQSDNYQTNQPLNLNLPKMSVSIVVLNPEADTTPTPDPEPTPTPTSVTGSGNGLKTEYFNNMDLSDLAVTKTEATVDHIWGMDAPVAGVAADTFSVRWSGQIEAQKTETYSIHTVSDDGVRLYINNQLVIDNWTNHSTTTDTANIDMVVGEKYDIRMEYFENGWDATARLLWSSPSTSQAVIPQSQLYSEATPAPQPDTNYSNAQITGIDGKCITAQNNATTNGTQMTIDNCSDSSSQRYDLNAAGELRIKSASDKCIDVSSGSTANGAKIQLWTCNGSVAQKWTYTSAGELKGPGGKCVDLRYSDPTPGNIVQLYECNGTNAQKWQFVQ